MGRKYKMSQIWKENQVVPVTVIKAEPNMVSLVRIPEKDGYSAAQIQLGNACKEFRVKEGIEIKRGDSLDVSVFKEGDMVRVSAITKGRGYQGVVKRHGFSGGPKTHGQKNRHRAPGSIGNTTPQRVIPGRRMAGHMGVDRVTIKNLKIAGVDKEQNLLLVKGAVPGARGGLVEIELNN